MKILLILHVVAIGTFGLYGQTRIENLLTEAETNIRNSRYDIAIKKVEEALSIEPSNKQAIRLRINIYYLINDYKEALDIVEEAIQRFPGDGNFYYQRGLIHIGRQKFNKAIDDFNRIIDGYGDFELYKVYLNRGVAYMNLQEDERALEDISRSIDLNSNNASAYHSRGMLNYQHKDYESAVEDFQQALLYNENNAETNFNLGMSYFRLEEKDSACPYFHKACKEGNLNACKMVLMECARNMPE
jgi:tetratricopeptide (TPR) repeat protein